MVKKRKFAISVDEYGRNKKYLAKLLDLLKEEYPFLKQANRIAAKKRLASARVDDVIAFGFSKKYDFKVITQDEWEEYSVHRRTSLFDLKNDWNDIDEALEEYAEANYPDEYDEDDDCCIYASKRKHYCTADELIYVDDDRKWEDLYVYLPKSKKKQQQRTRKSSSKKLQLEDVDVKYNHVRVGWDVFDIWLNKEGEEYVTIDKNTYWIDRDSRGRGKLAVQ